MSRSPGPTPRSTVAWIPGERLDQRACLAQLLVRELRKTLEARHLRSTRARRNDPFDRCLDWPCLVGCTFGDWRLVDGVGAAERTLTPPRAEIGPAAERSRRLPG